LGRKRGGQFPVTGKKGGTGTAGSFLLSEKMRNDQMKARRPKYRSYQQQRHSITSRGWDEGRRRGRRKQKRRGSSSFSEGEEKRKGDVERKGARNS